MNNYIFNYVDGHIEVYLKGEGFVFSADTIDEAWREIEEEVA